MKYLYYPGCSLEGTAKEYDISTRAMAAALDMELVELADWTCCGATAGSSAGHWLALALPGRNLAIAEKMAEDPEILVPCSACYLNLKTAEVTARKKGGGHGQHQPLPGTREPVDYGKKHHQAPARRAFAGRGTGENPGQSGKAPGGLDPGALLRLPVPSPPRGLRRSGTAKVHGAPAGGGRSYGASVDHGRQVLRGRPT